MELTKREARALQGLIRNELLLGKETLGLTTVSELEIYVERASSSDFGYWKMLFELLERTKAAETSADNDDE